MMQTILITSIRAFLKGDKFIVYIRAYSTINILFQFDDLLSIFSASAVIEIAVFVLMVDSASNHALNKEFL